jgi:hypothetical protein
MTRARRRTDRRGGRFSRRLLALLSGAALALLSGVITPPTAWAAGALYVGPATDPAFVAIAPRLLTALYPEQRLTAMAVPDGTASLERVMADPTSAALTNLATMLAFATSKKLATDRLEFHGPLAQQCLLAFARRDGWVRAFSDLIETNGTPRPTVGLAGPGAEPLLGILRGLEPGLANVDVQPGDPDALAAQVARGAPDLLLLVAYPELDHDLIERLAGDDRLTALPVVTRLLSRAAFDRDSGFTMQPVRTDNGLVPWGRHKLITLCTPVGLVLRGDARPALRDAVNRAVPTVATALVPSLPDRVGAAATNTLHDTLDAVQGLITRLRSN